MPRSLQAVPRPLAALILGFAILWPAGTVQGDSYEECVARIDVDADEAFDSAIAWRDLGGDEPARHCAALALVELGLFAAAAERFEALAQDMTGAPDTVRARVLAQAGQARLASDDTERAYGTFTAALELAPEDAEIWIDRSQALAAAANYFAAIDDLDRALELEPENLDALIFRASAYRQVNTPALALEDINAVLAAAPGQVDALLERGNIRRLAGDAIGAHTDWLAVLYHMPEGPAADAARLNIERLDLDAGADDMP